MLFVEFRFFWFFLAVFCVYWSLRENRSRKIWLLLCSYFFYAAWNWKFLFLLMASSGLDYVVGMMLARTEVGGYCAHCQTLRAREVEEVRSQPAPPPKRAAAARRSRSQHA